MTPTLEARCPACGEQTFIRREPIYDGFQKVGDKRFCSDCGYEFEEEETPQSPKANPLKDIFGDDTDNDDPDIFSDTERQRCCRYCKHYIVNPFTQRCGLHERDVDATDLCKDFERPPPEEEKAKAPPAS
ncbi:MAG: hypothetical protein ISS35_00290 [Kiritimatiellae bacterium]|nr:hypothetical protein [Kiritimatiellia bacterium]